MEEHVQFHLLISDVLFSILSLLLFVGDVVLDAWAVVSLYQEEDYIFMGLLIVLLVGSSVLIQTFSWIWYKDSAKYLETTIEMFVQRHGLFPLVHVCQLGIFLRCAGVVEISIRSCKKNNSFQISADLKHDLSMLRLFEAFSESAPQLMLMMIIILKTQELQLFTAIKLLGSLSALALTVVSYHRNMRAFTSTKSRMSWSSSALYFLWNLFLIGPRVVSMSLFASVLPCYVAAHFLSWWMLLVFWAWMQKTDFMDSTAGEWLYRGTVALVWYFSWFNMKKGRTKLKALFYHVVMITDMMLLLGLWWWRRSVESARLGPLPVPPYVLVLSLILSYVTGLVLQVVYYWKWHPNKSETQSKERPKPECNSSETPEELRLSSADSSSSEEIYQVVRLMPQPKPRTQFFKHRPGREIPKCKMQLEELPRPFCAVEITPNPAGPANPGSATPIPKTRARYSTKSGSVYGARLEPHVSPEGLEITQPLTISIPRSSGRSPTQPVFGIKKRMRNMADNFYGTDSTDRGENI